jgi:hypothetical protein
MTFDTETISEAIHTGLRKGCDSTTSSAAWNCIFLMKDENWNKLVECIRQEFESVGELPKPIRPKDKEEKFWWDLSWAWGEVLGPILKRACTKRWQPYRDGHDAMTLFCIFELFPNNDWNGTASFLSYALKD